MSTTKWIDLCFLAEAERQPFTEAQLITLKGHFWDAVMTSALVTTTARRTITDSFYMDVEKEAQNIVKSKQIQVREFIEISDKIVICLNKDCLNEEFMCDAMDRLSKLDTLQPGLYEFGQFVSYNMNEIPQLIKH